MSDSSAFSSPHFHLLGAKVSFTSDLRAELGLEWSDGIIVATLDTPHGVGVHVCNPETGETTEAVTLAALKLHPETVKLITAYGETVSKTMEATNLMLRENMAHL